MKKIMDSGAIKTSEELAEWVIFTINMLNVYKNYVLAIYKMNEGKFQQPLGIISALSKKNRLIFQANEQAIKSCMQIRYKENVSSEEKEEVFNNIYNIFESVRRELDL